ncbi:MAG: helix-turn-helix domain-containing protein [Myxococcota bacterium]
MDIRHFVHFSDLVRAIRQANRLSQRALAKALRVSPGYIGQWELRLSQPSPEVAVKLCRIFDIEDIEYVQRLAYAQRAPEWLRESIVMYQKDSEAPAPPSPVERRILEAARKLTSEQIERLAERVEGWVDAMADSTPESKKG